MDFIKRFIRKILLPNTYSSEAYRKYLIKKGCIVGNNTIFYSPNRITIDTQNALHIEIGDYCKITQGVVILAHDYSYSILRRVYGTIPKKMKKTKIGDNCFIGINSIILMGSEIGDNVIIGAGSVVSGRIPSNQVWAGNPARFICTLDEYNRKCCERFEDSAFNLIKEYKTKLARYPNVNELQYFSTLFYDYESIEDYYEQMSFSGDDKSEVLKTIRNQEKKYENIDQFYNKKITCEEGD